MPKGDSSKKMNVKCATVCGSRNANDDIGLMVQRDDTALAWRKSGFDSRSVH